METKKPDKKQVVVPNVTALPVVILDDKEMSVISGGGIVLGD